MSRAPDPVHRILGKGGKEMGVPERQEIESAKEGGNSREIWQAFKDAWHSGDPVPMDAATFTKLFYQGEESKDAARLAVDSKLARTLLHDAALKACPGDLLDRDRHLVFSAAVTLDETLDYWRKHRDGVSVGGRSEWARLCIRTAHEAFGRERARQIATSLWGELTLEEERESALRELDNHGGLSMSLLRNLGGDALSLVRSMVHRNILQPPLDFQASAINIASSAKGESLRRRVEALLHPLSVKSDLRDAGLEPSELARVSAWSDMSQPSLELLATWAEEMGIMPREHVLRRAQQRGTPHSFPFVSPRIAAHPPTLELPLLRVLHMRELLNAPELRSARLEPERYLVPDLFLHLLEVEQVIYVPELRVGKANDRRWRARWAESMGEAVSTLFMEAALDMDLTLLERIPETTAGPTADFKAAALDGEHFVYEAKGSTSWQTHLSQRKKALRQLGKAAGQATDGASRARDGRAFACAFYGALQGEDSSTLFHVEDPPFGFEHLFPSGWEERARRRHYAAALQFSGQFELAEQLLQPDSDQETSQATEAQQFRLQLGDASQEDLQFWGTSEDLGSLARTLRLRNPMALDGWKVFRGLADGLFAQLRNRHVPGVHKEDDAALPVLPPVGVIPREPGEPGRGVYSLLANGCLIAIETS